ncbi:LysR substrate-binding domain-containing protein [Sphingomonas sp. AR_OL41]|uniref:LysR substrate-binding domain-containing protein n=1 Tax=Sphingomonas sp. AR_OL41 TaxID=3042729 RepID=UPI00247FD368|nr:LysR substrate-binding domain-containing protein [Sphingomonas sp. AR_OL41]MDH7975149.1 LysR substrate-binding domain-containing protein [Sphingomonas sp. AR_OL41]
MRNWDDLRIFLAVARAQRLAAAARLLGIDVTTVGRRLARLDAAIGAPLFATIGGERRLSEAGQALLLHAETIEAAVLAASERDRQGSALSGHVRLSLAEGLATHVVAPGLARFRSDHPQLRLDLITASGFLNPSKREADIAVMLARPRNRQLQASRLADYRLQLYATRDYLDTHGTPADAAALRDHALIGYVPEHIHAVELDYLSEIHAGLVARARSTSINVQHAMIRTGAGIGILPDFIARGDARLVGVLSDRVSLGRTFWLVTHEDTHATPRIEAVTAWLRAVVAGIG